jgi:pimeloyl-ACP methyl ester carboxylesterase
MLPKLYDFTVKNPLGVTRKMAYAEWGNSSNPQMLICVHGLTLNSRDFDRLGEALAPYYRVICPDIVGRGRSDWLQDPAHYNFATYVQDLAQLMAYLGVSCVDWLGTSMGGLIGMFLADAMPGSIRRLILNDVGPYISAASLQQLAEEVTTVPEFADLLAAELYMRYKFALFGIEEDRNWRHVTEHFFVQLPNGNYRAHYDPTIITSTFQEDRSQIAAFDAWEMWERLKLQDVLCIRGEKSDILSAETAYKMSKTGSGATIVTLPGIGHAPALLEAEQVEVVREWLISTPTTHLP